MGGAVTIMMSKKKKIILHALIWFFIQLPVSIGLLSQGKYSIPPSWYRRSQNYESVPPVVAFLPEGQYTLFENETTQQIGEVNLTYNEIEDKFILNAHLQVVSGKDTVLDKIYEFPEMEITHFLLIRQNYGEEQYWCGTQDNNNIIIVATHNDSYFHPIPKKTFDPQNAYFFLSILSDSKYKYILNDTTYQPPLYRVLPNSAYESVYSGYFYCINSENRLNKGRSVNK
jgi:hypothetical protein